VATNIISKPVKRIAVVIIISAVLGTLSLLWSSRSGLIALAASIGGMIVFLGLWIEKEAEEEKKENFSDFAGDKRLIKLKSEIGWWILMSGIFIEVVTAGGFAAYDAVENKRTADKIRDADPRNLPIVSIIGSICIVVQPPFKSFATNLNLPKKYGDPQFYTGADGLPSVLPFLLSDDKELRKHEMVFFDFGEQPGEYLGNEIQVMGQVSAMVDIVSDSKTNEDNIGFEINLYPPTDNSPVFNPDSLTFNSLDFVHFSLREVLPPPLKIVGGKIELLINGFFPKSFPILPQTNENSLNVFCVETNNPAGETNSTLP
jgi:hypothetical protein